MKPVILATREPNPTEYELRSRALSRKAAAEGFVLLKNDGVLPLKNKRLALYGAGARMTVKGGTGSGQVRERYSVSIAEGLANAGLEITTAGWLDRFDKFYADTYETYRRTQEEKVAGVTEFYKILGMVEPFRHPSGIAVTAEDIRESDCDTAVYVLARQAGEGHDRRDEAGDYRLDETEKENLRTLAEGYKHLIVIVNVGGVVDLGFMDELPVSALVYYAQGGQEGGNALGELLTGKANFSGKLATSWAYRFEDLPSNKTYSYLGKDPYVQEYNEGIYVGYRFFDTFGVKPRYAFGYGLSYTSFSITAGNPEISADGIRLGVSVQNTGSVCGKEVVQLYVSVPFGTEGAESKRLVGFAKTAGLAPGETAEVTLKVPLRELACYDEAANAWVLRAGEYILRLGNSSDNTAPLAVLTLGGAVVLEQCQGVCPLRQELEEITPPVRETEDLSAVPRYALPADIPCVCHSYAGLPVYPDEAVREKIESMTDEQLVQLVVGAGTGASKLQVCVLGVSGNTTGELYDSCGIPNVALSDGPAGLNVACQIVELPDGSCKAARVPAMLEAYKRYLFGTAGMALKRQMADPGEGISHYQYAAAWPCSQLLAQTWNQELLESIGDAVGAEMEALGVTVWLAPGMNIHRNPLCGRTFEYFSEDPFVSGKMAGALVRGVQRHPGKGVSVKHYAANSCELNRNESDSRLSQRALREIYLHGFEIAVKESGPMTVMAAYNKINGVYCTNNYELLVKVLRNEWGFEGMVMSDWDSMKAHPDNPMQAVTGDVLKAMAAQNDLVCPGRPDQRKALLNGIEQGIVSRDDLKRCAGRVLAMIRKNTVLKSQ